MQIRNKTPKDFTVGQKLYCVPNRSTRAGGKAHWVVVTKVGKRWVSVKQRETSWQEDRFDPKDGLLDGGDYSSHGAVYLSSEDYKAEVYRRTLWDGLYSYTRNNNNPPDSLDTDTLEKVIVLLGAKDSVDAAYKKRTEGHED